MRFLVTSKCRANGRHVAAGEILDATNSDVSTLKALHDGGRGRYVADDYEAAPKPVAAEESLAVAVATSDPEAQLKPEVPDPKPITRRGRPRKDQ